MMAACAHPQPVRSSPTPLYIAEFSSRPRPVASTSQSVSGLSITPVSQSSSGPSSPCACKNCRIVSRFRRVQNGDQEARKDMKACPYTSQSSPVCRICGKVFARKNALKSHLIRHSGARTYECSHCHKSFPEHNDLTRHVRVVHEGFRPYECGVCHHRFPTRTKLSVHERVHSGERPFQCSHCSFASATKSNLQRHESKVHSSGSPASSPASSVHSP